MFNHFREPDISPPLIRILVFVESELQHHIRVPVWRVVVDVRLDGALGLAAHADAHIPVGLHEKLDGKLDEAEQLRSNLLALPLLVDGLHARYELVARVGTEVSERARNDGVALIAEDHGEIRRADVRGAWLYAVGGDEAARDGFAYRVLEVAIRRAELKLGCESLLLQRGDRLEQLVEEVFQLLCLRKQELHQTLHVLAFVVVSIPNQAPKLLRVD